MQIGTKNTRSCEKSHYIAHGIVYDECFQALETRIEGYRMREEKSKPNVEFSGDATKV